MIAKELQMRKWRRIICWVAYIETRKMLHVL